MENAENKQQDKWKTYRKGLFWRKARLYILLVLAFLACLLVTERLFNDRFVSRLYPQINRAVSQISKLLPQLRENELTLRDVYAQMEESRKKVSGESADWTDDGIDPTVLESLSWMNRISRLKVGYDGSVIVVRKEDGTILAHPDKRYVGQTMLMLGLGTPRRQGTTGLFANIAYFPGVASMELEDFEWKEGEGMRMALRTFRPTGWKYSDLLEGLLNGSVISYGDKYIIVGVGMPEYFSYMYYALLLSLIVLVILWLFVKYICIHMERHEERTGKLGGKLMAYSCVVAVVILLVSWYIQVLYDVSIDLKTMEHHAKVAVETLQTHQDTQKRVNSWLDDQYLKQCRAAGAYLRNANPESLSREDMAALAENLGVEYVFLFNKYGAVTLTNSPYDHFTLSADPESQSYPFRVLLQGVDHLVQQPMPEELSGQMMQFIGVSLRDEKDMSDGFVQIAVKPDLRNLLADSLSVQRVLDMLVIGLPQHAVAIDKETMKLTATTGVGYVGQTAEEFGVTRENLQESYSGFLNFDGDTYYAGFGETSDSYLVPVVRRTRETEPFVIAFFIALVSLVSLIGISLLALFRYDRSVVDNYPEGEEPVRQEKTKKPSVFSDLIGEQQKWDFDKRWQIGIPMKQLSPERQIKRIAGRFLILVSVLALLPHLFAEFNNVRDTTGMIGLGYVLAGSWEKGVNIFAFSACVFLALILFVFKTLSNRVLYHIAKVSDMRAETICLLLRSSLRYIVIIAFVYYGLSQFGIPSQALLASAGIVTLAISVGAKDFINDIIAGFFILIEGNFKVEDFVTIGNFYGFVDVIGIRTTKVSFHGETKIFNNSTIREVINNVGPVNVATVKVPIPVDADLEAVEAVLREELPKLMEEMPYLVKPPYFDGVTDWTTDSLIIRIRVKTEVGMHYKADRELKRHLKIIFDRNGIRIPYRQVELHMAPDENGSGFRKGSGTSEPDARTKACDGTGECSGFGEDRNVTE